MSPLLLLLLLGGGLALAAGAGGGDATSGGDQSSQSPALSEQPNVFYARPATVAEVQGRDAELASYLAERNASTLLMIVVDDAGEQGSASALVSAAKANPGVEFLVLNIQAAMAMPEFNIMGRPQAGVVTRQASGFGTLYRGLAPSELVDMLPDLITQATDAMQTQARFMLQSGTLRTKQVFAPISAFLRPRVHMLSSPVVPGAQPGTGRDPGEGRLPGGQPGTERDPGEGRLPGGQPGTGRDPGEGRLPGGQPGTGRDPDAQLPGGGQARRRGASGLR